MKCAICNAEPAGYEPDAASASMLIRYRCQRCGTYRISRDTLTQLSALSPDDRRRLQATARQAWSRKNELTLTPNDLSFLIAGQPPRRTPMDSADALVLYLGARVAALHQTVTITPGEDFPLFNTLDGTELEYLIRLLTKELKLVDDSALHIATRCELRLTPAGWARYDELRRSNRQADRAFVAMWFDPTLAPVFDEAIAPALDAAGYRPDRIDRVHFPNKIDDEILARIKRCAVLVADFTSERDHPGGRGGVYFEVGYALGLGVPVIWTIRKDQLPKVHFDTRQYPFIDWSDAEDLKKRLADRIGALLPQ
jgi:hypothetical protein